MSNGTDSYAANGLNQYATITPEGGPSASPVYDGARARRRANYKTPVGASSVYGVQYCARAVLGLSAFAADDQKQRQWRAFVKDVALDPGALANVLNDLTAFLMPHAEAAAKLGE